MPNIILNVSDETLPRLRQEATARGFASPEEYVNSLLLEDLRRRDQERLEAVLLERLDSGQSVEMDDADFRRIREQAEARIAQRHNR
jgi:antitoxin ParD1/3/4